MTKQRSLKTAKAFYTRWRGKIFIEYEPIETAWIPISGKNYEYNYCLWVAGSFKGKGIGKELLEYAINDSKEKGKSGICTNANSLKKLID